MATVLHRPRSRERQQAAIQHGPDETVRERPLWEQVVLLYAGIFLLGVFLTAACFLSAWLAAGKPY